jgi:hypothetical protein
VSEKIVKLMLRLSRFFSVNMYNDERWRAKCPPIFGQQTTLPLRRRWLQLLSLSSLGIGERACLSGGGCDDGCCRRHFHLGGTGRAGRNRFPRSPAFDTDENPPQPARLEHRLGVGTVDAAAQAVSMALFDAARQC